MEIITEPVQKKRKRFNKNKKKAWRKKINISDIEEHLEDQRREERLGGALAERISDELFSLDYGVNHGKEKKKASKRKAKVAKFIFNEGFKPLHVRNTVTSLKCHQYINGLPGAKAISIKKGTMKQQERKVIKTAKKVSKGTPTANLQRMVIQKQRRADLAKKKTVEGANFQDDLWTKSKDNLKIFNNVVKTFMEEPVSFYEVQTKQNKVKTPNVRYEKPSLLPAVIVPKSGASYNPSFDAHQKLLAEALNVENKKQKKEVKEKRMIEKYLPSSKDGITDSDKLLEMSEGLPINENRHHMEMFGDEEVKNDEEENFVGHKKIEKKSKQTRTKAKTLKVKEFKRLEKKELNRRQSKIYSLKSYGRSIKKMEEETELLREKRKQKRKEDQYKTKKLSRHKIEEDDVLVPLGNEISGSLRLVEPVGNPLDVVYKSYQKRNIIEKRGRRMRSTRKQKMVYKSTCKGELNLLRDDED